MSIVRTLTRRARAAAGIVAALATGIAACASSPDPGGFDELQTGYTYQFSGSEAGETVEGSIFFADEGGYLIRSSHGTCDHTGGVRAEAWERSQEGRRTLSIRCQDLQLSMTLDPDGEIRSGVGTFSRRELEERRGSCAEYDTTTGACIRWNWVTVPVTRRFDVRLRFTSG